MERTTKRNDILKKKLLNRLNRLEGQIRGLKTMVEEDIYCDDILTQIAATKGALNGISRLVLENHLKNCIVRDIKNEKENTIDELLSTIERMTKL